MKVLFGIFYGKPPFGLYSIDLGMTWMDWEALMGAPKGVAGQAYWSSLELHMASHVDHKTLMCDLMHGVFGKSVEAHYPLVFL